MTPRAARLYGKPIAGERLVNGEYEEYPLAYGVDGSVRSHSELLDVVFHYNGEEFDALDPATGLTIDRRVVAEVRADAAEARAIVAEAELNLEQTARSQAEARASAAEAELARIRAQLRGEVP